MTIIDNKKEKNQILINIESTSKGGEEDNEDQEELEMLLLEFAL
jgi:hypothetical protein